MQKVNETLAGPANRGTGYRFFRKKSAYLGILPFLILTGLFLLYPTYSVIWGAFHDGDNKFSTEVLTELFQYSATRDAFKNSMRLSGVTAILGAIIGAMFAWAMSVGNPDSRLKRFSLSASGVFAQFGGVMLTFAFLATFGFNGLVTSIFLKYFPTSSIANPTWLYGMNGLIVVYLFFQIPLMFLVFMPAMENMRPQWREASDSLGGDSKEFWLRVGLPILIPSFLGGALLLFANAFSAYATAAALITSGQFITPLQIANAISSEIGTANAAVAKSIAFFMIIVVVVIMGIYSLILRKVSKWDIK